jgi:hypothetical protein
MVNMTPITLVFNTMATMVNVVLQCLVSQLITGEPHIVAYLVVPPNLVNGFCNAGSQIPRFVAGPAHVYSWGMLGYIPTKQFRSAVNHEGRKNKMMPHYCEV